MKIGVLGTGMVGETIGSRLIQLGHEVQMGSRSSNNEKACAWVQKAGARASQGTFADAAKFGELVFNCTKGEKSVEALRAAGKENLKGKVLIDLANPLDLNNQGTLLFCNTDSLGERIQAAFPNTKVVKTLNTMWCGIMLNPRMLKGTHNVFLAGNDQSAKSQVVELLTSFGWQNDEIVDLGDIRGARGTEMILPLWLRIYQPKGSGAFNLRIVQ